MSPLCSQVDVTAFADVKAFADGERECREQHRPLGPQPWSTGPVEGHITRLRLIERQGYGRAGLDTPKGRFLRAA
jgi:transposase